MPDSQKRKRSVVGVITERTAVELSMVSALVVLISGLVYGFAGRSKDIDANAGRISKLELETETDRKTINEKLDKMNDGINAIGKDVSRMKGILEHKLH